MDGGSGDNKLFSPTLIEAMLANAPGYIATLDPDGAILGADRVPQALGTSQIIGTSAFDFVDAGSVERLRAAIRSVVETRQPCSFEARLPGPDGTPAPHQNHLGPIVRDGELIALSWFASNEADLCRSATALRDSKQKLRLAVEATGMGVWSWDARTDVVTWDEVMCRHFRIAPAQAPTTYAGYRELIYPADRDMVVASVGRAVETGVYEDIEHRIELPNGEIRWLLIKGTVERNHEGAVERLLGGVFDITDRRRLDDKLRHSQKLEAVGQLAAGVAHNFNNTLTSVLSSLQLIARRAPASLQSDIADALESARGAVGVVEQLVKLAGHGDVDVHRLVAVDDIADRVVRMCRRTFDRNVAIDLEHSSDHITAMINPTLVEQALLNLCINARDAVGDGQVPSPRIRVSVASENIEPADVLAIGQRPAGRYARIQVTDNGLGIAAADRQHIFEPFFTTKAAAGRGSGLGLATANAAIVEHDGWIDCDSTPGAGTIFTIHLPACADDVADHHDEPLQSETTPPEGSGTILLVDDESLVRTAIARLLEDGGFTVLQAANGEHALELFQDRGNQIDAVLLDHSMPGLSGRDVLARLLAIDPDARVVMFTGYLPTGGSYPGAAAVLTKPADEAILFATLREAAGRYH